MQTKQNLTGYPSIDKPWLKYYSEEAINTPLPECTVYEYLWENNKDHLDDVALIYFGRKITYSELFENIDKTAAAFSAIGVKSGDVVTGIAPSLPEVIYSFYAINKIGAVSNWIDPRTDPATIHSDLVNTKTKVVLILDDFYKGFSNLLKKFSIQAITYSVKDSLPAVPKAVMKLKKSVSTEGAISYYELLTKYSSMALKNEPFTPNKLALLEHTGGTTGISKAVMLSNENVNSVVEQYRRCGTPLEQSHSWLTVAFPFTAYSLICSQHLPLCCGMRLHLCYDLKLEKIEETLLKNRLNHMANTPVMWEHLTNSKQAQKTDFSFLFNPTVGADTLDVEKEKKINAFLEEHGCKFKINKGYGMTEVSSAISACISIDCNKLGSVGIPFPKITVSIFDLDTEKELPYEEQGEICISGPSVMLGYYNNDEETNKVLKTHSDGTVWMHSGDFGHMDEDDCLFIDGRIKRMLIDHHGFKIFTPAIEKAIQQVSGVEKCCVVGIKDKQYKVGQAPVAFIISDKSVFDDELLNNMKNKCHSELPDYAVPAKFIFVDKFPYTSASKVDYRALEQEAEKL